MFNCVATSIIELKDNTILSGFKINITGNNNGDHFGIKIDESLENIQIKNNEFNFSGVYKVISSQLFDTSPDGFTNNFLISDKV